MHDTNIVSLNFMRVGDCCLTPKWDFLKYLSWREQVGTTGATSGAGTAYPSGVPEFTLRFIGVCVAQSLVFCLVFCILTFCPFSFGHCVVCSSIYGF
jgi:hypothetical protein